jgi:hypothetical protein
MRIVGWQRALNAYLIDAQERYKAEGFRWGAFDCVHFLGDWIRIATGDDPLADFRGQYSTREEAFALLERTYGSLQLALTARIAPPVHASKAARGDGAFISSLNACGIFFTSGGRMCALFLGEGGFALHRARDIYLAFKVG